MTMKRIAIEIGMGTDIRGGDYTKAAVRALRPDERAGLRHWAEKYVVNGAYCLRHGIQVGAPRAT